MEPGASPQMSIDGAFKGCHNTLAHDKRLQHTSRADLQQGYFSGQKGVSEGQVGHSAQHQVTDAISAADAGG